MKLTTTQKVQIRELQSHSLDYRIIAKELDLPVSTVKSLLT